MAGTIHWKGRAIKHNVRSIGCKIVDAIAGDFLIAASTFVK